MDDCCFKATAGTRATAACLLAAQATAKIDSLGEVHEENTGLGGGGKLIHLEKFRRKIPDWMIVVFFLWSEPVSYGIVGVGR